MWSLYSITGPAFAVYFRSSAPALDQLKPAEIVDA
jgi:hypothetical protein